MVQGRLVGLVIGLVFVALFYLRRRATTDLAFDKSQKIKTALAVLIPSGIGLLWLEFVYRSGGFIFPLATDIFMALIIALISFATAAVLSKERRIKYGIHAAGFTFQILVLTGFVRLFLAGLV